MKLLIVDDVEFMARAWGRLLKPEVDEVLIATTLQEAIEKIDKVDIVLTDWYLEPGTAAPLLDFGKPVIVSSIDLIGDRRIKWLIEKGEPAEIYRQALNEAKAVVRGEIQTGEVKTKKA